MVKHIQVVVLDETHQGLAKVQGWLGVKRGKRPNQGQAIEYLVEAFLLDHGIEKGGSDE